MEIATRLMTYAGGALMAALLIGAAAGCGGDSGGGGPAVAAAPAPPPPPPPGSCQPSSSLSVLVTGKNVVSYVPKGRWSNGGSTGVALVNIEGTSITAGEIATANIVNSCASNPTSAPATTVCTANNTDVYVIPAGSTPTVTTLTSAGSGSIGFSGGSCTNCGVAMDAVHNKAVIGLSLAGGPGFQFLDLGASPTFETAFTSPSGAISEDPLIDPTRNLLLSATESNDYEIVNIKTTTSPQFFENTISGAPGELDSSGEDCSTGLALAPAECPSPSQVFLADLSHAKLTAGTPGTWTAPSQVQTLTESNLECTSGVAIAQGTHTGLVSSEFGGNSLTAVALPKSLGGSTPAVSDWMTCGVGGEFQSGYDPHTVTAYLSPNSGHAIALLANDTATQLAVVDLTAMLNATTVPRTSGAGLGHACSSGTLPSSVVSFITVP